jgi:sortase A
VSGGRLVDHAQAPLADAGQTLAAFYDRRAPAALAYCARLCEPESIADAVEEAFGQVFAAAAGGGAVDEEELDRLLRDAVRTAAAECAPGLGGSGRSERRVREAERAYDALLGDDAPALGRSLLAEMIEAEPAPAFEWDAEPPAAPAPPEPEQPEQQTRPHWRRRLVIVLAVVGVLLLAEAVVTLAWKEPFTGYLAAQAQDDLDKQLDKLDRERVGLGASEQRSLAAIHDADARARKRMSLLAARLDEKVGEGEALGRIEIARLGIDFVFVQGIDGASLRKGPGHYHGDTQLPGQGGTAGIAGHRTTYEAPFREIDSLEAGDKITLRMPYGQFTYQVTGHRIVPADYGQAFSAAPAGGGGGERLVLSACHPLYSSSERILVDAKLVASRPLGSAVETTVPPFRGAPTARELARRRTAARLKLLGTRQLGPATTGPDVRELQRLLGMPVTGAFDPNTTAAVLAFQRDHGLPQVGLVGGQTKQALARQPHPPSRPPTPADVPEQRPTEPGGGTYTGPTTTTPYQSPRGTQSTP